MLLSGKVKFFRNVSRSESESEQGVQSDGADAKPSDLPMARLKSRNRGWRTEPVYVEKCSDELWVGVKG